ncbi:MAG: DNA topoisomerase VI subunit B [Nanoarchaeota archaeon]
MIKAEELAQKQREISVSEFFTKNRHLLGFDSPAKAILMAVKEACDNSLTYDMPFVIKTKGKISIVKIGEFVDNFINKNEEKSEKLRNGSLEKLRLDEGIAALAFDKKTFKLSFRNISTIFRHKVNSKIYRVKLVSGRYVDLTAYHSVFTLNQGKVISIPTADLKEGMSIVVPKKLWNNQSINEINLIEELLLLEPSLTNRINIYGITSLFTDQIIKNIKDLLPKNKWYKIGDFKKCNYLPLNILRNLNIDLNSFSESKIGTSLCRYKIPAILKIDNNLAELLGFYVSEGSMLKTGRRLHFSFGSHEKEFIYYVQDLYEKVFKIKPKIGKAHNTAYNVISNCTILCFVLKNIFKVGTDAKDKKIPQFVFNFPANLKYSFLLAYLAGDGYPSKKIFDILKNNLLLTDLDIDKTTCATASNDLFIGLQYILSSLGLSYSTSIKEPKERIINEIRAKFGKSYYIYIPTKGKNSDINYLPVKDTISSTIDLQIKHSILRYNQKNLHIETIMNSLSNSKLILHEGLDSFLAGDLGLLEIVKIEEIPYHKEWVYDVSVPECENFVAGMGAIVCHNSLDACEEMRVLPEIKVEIKEVSENRFKVDVEDNGPGIVKEQIPKVFAKLLYGSKFHRLRCSRGQQGIGISAAVLYSQLTTGKPAIITSKISPKQKAHRYWLHINTAKNEPEIIKEDSFEWNKDHGTKVEIELEGKYQKGKQSVDEFLKQVAIVNPHAKITYVNPLNEKIEYPRVTNEMPAEAVEIKPHPYGIELGILIKMLKSTESRTLSSFLQNDFSRISSVTAKEICDKANLDQKLKPEELTLPQSEALYKAMQNTKIIAPPTNCLTPIEEELLIKGLQKEINAEFYTSVSRSPVVYKGRPFLIEVGVAYGGDIEKEAQVRLMRFANRVPLLYQQGACSITEAVQETNWRPYGLQQSSGSLPYGPLVLVVHMASVWVPFTSESKDAIAHYEDIIKEIRLGLQECGRRLGIYIRKNVKAKEQKEKIDLFTKFIPELASSLSSLTGEKSKTLEEELTKILNKNMKELLSNIDNAEIKQEIREQMKEHLNGKKEKIEVKKTKKEIQTQLK